VIATQPSVPNLAAIAALYTKPVPAPRPSQYENWDGTHCCYIYTADTLTDFPPVPTFKGDKSKDT
jgi:hypothetical protein